MNPKPHGILYTLEDRPELIEGLAQFGPILARMRRPDLAQTPEAVRDQVEILITTGGSGASADFINALPNLRLIACWGAGYENVDLKAAAAKGVKVCYSPGANAASVADLAVALLLDSIRRVTFCDRFVRSAEWEKPGNIRPQRKRGVTGRKIGVLGLGEIGWKIAKRLEVFETEVCYHNRRPRADAPWRYFDSLIGMARHCDVLMVALRADATNRRVVNADVIHALGRDGHLVNISRGSVIDEPALIAALRDGRIEGAGLDVFEREPHVPPELRELSNVVLTPHMGGGAVEALLAMSSAVVTNVAAFVSGETLPYPVPEMAALG